MTMQEPYDCLYNVVVRRLRAANTIFGQNIKLVLRQLSDEQWALLTLPYLLVVPTVTRIRVPQAQDQPPQSIVNPHSITFLAQLDGRGSEADWRAACDIEIVEKQLIGSLVNWRPPSPMARFLPTAYAGMRVEATRAPAVKVAFVFMFFEQLYIAEDMEEYLAQTLNNPDCAELGGIVVKPRSPCCPEEPPPGDCVPTDPCWPDLMLTAEMVRQQVTGEDQHDHQYDGAGERWSDRL